MLTKQCGKCEAQIGRTCRTCPKCGAVTTKNSGAAKPAKKPGKPKRLAGFRALTRALEKRKALEASSSPSLRAHVCTTLAALEAVIDLENADPMVAAAFRSHREAVALAGAKA